MSFPSPGVPIAMSGARLELPDPRLELVAGHFATAAARLEVTTVRFEVLGVPIAMSGAGFWAW